ncbi:related to Protein GET1 [Ustilago trichophora]|uniref:Related to Protein GET1 n=1 Tax=Ustilago trichophora TaxID=86804 RepID=A0A5C3DQA0_9BASI|nr:related to Protein GET1 [Ustilago trichophora]
MHPAVVILISVVIVQSIAAFGKERLQDILWFLYTAIFHRSTLSKQRTLRRTIFTTKQELAATSSQDQFAKWAKLRRKVDKGLADLEKTNSDLASARTTFSMLFKGVMFIITTVMPFCVTSWYSKTPIFWLPPGEHSWFGPLGWFLALPRAPKGAISSTVWQMVCSRTIIAVCGALANFWPGKREHVLSEAKLEEIQEEKQKNTTAKSASASSTTSTTPGAGGDGARKRTNAKPATVSEKQDL